MVLDTDYADRIGLRFKVHQLEHELAEASSEIVRHHELIVKLRYWALHWCDQYQGEKHEFDYPDSTWWEREGKAETEFYEFINREVG